MSFPYARLVQKFTNAPLMMAPAKAAILAEAYGPRALGADVLRVEMGIIGDELRDKVDWYGQKIYQGVRRVGAVAVIPIEGTLVDKGAWQGQHSGMTSYEALSLEVADALADEGVKAVVFEIDSPGGMVDGCFELGDEIYALSQIKPTAAILTSHACSAAYLLASACGAIFIPETGYAGSIGVISMYVNQQRRAKAEGFDVIIFAAGEKKADGHPLGDVRDEWVAAMTVEVDALRDHFATAVGRYRGESLTKQAALATEAGAYRGSDAVDAGLADAVASPKQAFAAFAAQFS